MDTIGNNETYIKLIAESESREDILKNHKEHFDNELDYSSGADIEDYDLVMVKSFAESIYSLQNSRKSFFIFCNFFSRTVDCRNHCFEIIEDSRS